jgi:hypothetical protein
MQPPKTSRHACTLRPQPTPRALLVGSAGGAKLGDGVDGLVPRSRRVEALHHLRRHVPGHRKTACTGRCQLGKSTQKQDRCQPCSSHPGACCCPRAALWAPARPSTRCNPSASSLPGPTCTYACSLADTLPPCASPCRGATLPNERAPNPARRRGQRVTKAHIVRRPQPAACLRPRQHAATQPLLGRASKAHHTRQPGQDRRPRRRPDAPERTCTAAQARVRRNRPQQPPLVRRPVPRGGLVQLPLERQDPVLLGLLGVICWPVVGWVFVGWWLIDGRLMVG